MLRERFAHVEMLGQRRKQTEAHVRAQKLDFFGIRRVAFLRPLTKLVSRKLLKTAPTDEATLDDFVIEPFGERALEYVALCRDPRRPVRILFSLLDAGLGGGQQVAVWLAEAAVARGHAVGLLVPEPGPTQARFAALRAQTHLARLQRLRDPRDVPDAARVLRDYDVLWSHTAIGGQLLGDAAARWARRPHVIHQHTYPQFASREPEATMQRLLARTFLCRRRFIAVAAPRA